MFASKKAARVSPSCCLRSLIQPLAHLRLLLSSPGQLTHASLFISQKSRCLFWCVFAVCLAPILHYSFLLICMLHFDPPVPFFHHLPACMRCECVLYVSPLLFVLCLVLLSVSVHPPVSMTLSPLGLCSFIISLLHSLASLFQSVTCQILAHR